MSDKYEDDGLTAAYMKGFEDGKVERARETCETCEDGGFCTAQDVMQDWRSECVVGLAPRDGCSHYRPREQSVVRGETGTSTKSTTVEPDGEASK